MAERIHLLYGVYLFHIHPISSGTGMGDFAAPAVVTINRNPFGTDSTAVVYLGASESW